MTAPILLWTLRRGESVATCEAVSHPIGIELVVSIGDDVERKQAFRLPTAVESKADELRRSFLDFGWVDVQDKQTAH